MAASSTPASLATIISETTNQIETYLHEKGLPPLSIHDAAQDEILKYPPEIESARRALVAATRELNELAEGPRDRLILGQNPFFSKTPILTFICHFKIYNHVPPHGTISFDALAEITHLNPSVITQFLRAATAHHLFREDPPGFIAHTSATRLLRDSPLIQDMTGFVHEESFPAMMHIVPALVAHPQANDPSQSAYLLMRNAPEHDAYAHLATDPAREQRFAGTMAAFARAAGYAPNHITENFPWSSLGAGTVIDIGGSTGEYAGHILKIAPELSIVVQDLPSVIALAQKQPPIPGVSFQVHDFFQPQPVHGADVYYMRWILHNWPDPFALRILRNLIPALKTGAKVLIIDEIMAAPGTETIADARNQHGMDIAMLAVFNAKLRRLDEWEALVHAADSRFHIDRITQPAGSHVGIIQLAWQG